MKFRSYFVSVLVFIFVGFAQANCVQLANKAQELCSSNAAIAEGAGVVQAIERDFKPLNGRMSPESCQAFRNAHGRFIDFTNQYIKKCEQATATAAMACRSGKGLKTFDELILGARTYKKARASLPVLTHYLQPNRNLSDRLNDCLKLTPGTIEVTNTNRGDASASTASALSQNSVSSNARHSSGVYPSRGFETKDRRGQSLPNDSQSRLAGRGNLPANGISGKNAAVPPTTAGSGAVVFNPNVARHSDDSIQRSGDPWQNSAHPGRLSRQPSSIGFDRNLRPSRRTAPTLHSLHVNIFAKIRERYRLERLAQ